MRLCGKIVKLVRGDIANQSNQAAGIGEVAVVQKEAIRSCRVGGDMIDARCVG